MQLPARTVPFRTIPWIILLLTPAFAANPTLTLEVSTETTLPGGTAQFKISVSSPALISSGALSIKFDPTIFGNVQGVTAFSATGDQTGYAYFNGTQVIAYFGSSSASLGQLPQLPVFVVNVPVLATATAGTSSTVTVDPTPAPWKDQQGNGYTVTAIPATFTVGGTLSISSVTPAGGLLPSGTVIAIDGTGFDASTVVTIDGVALASQLLVSPTQINLTLGGAAEMTGKHVHASNSSASIDYFSALPAPATFNSASLALILPLPLSPTQTSAQWQFPDNYNFTYYSCLQNPNAAPVTVNYYSDNGNNQVTTTTAIVPPYGLSIENDGALANTLGSLYMTASAPLKMTQLFVEFIAGPPGPANTNVTVPQPIAALGQFRIGATDVGPEGIGAIWNWQLGTPIPQPETAQVVSAFPFTASVSAAAQQWLTATPTSGGTGSTVLTLTPKVSNLGAGTYTATVTLTENLPPDLAPFGSNTLSLIVTLNISAQPTITGTSAQEFSVNLGDPPPPPQTINIITNGTPAPFTASVTCQSGGNWLTVTPTSGITSGPLTLTANTTGLTAGNYNCTLSIQGPINVFTIPVGLEIISGVVDTTPSSLAFTLLPGQGPSPSQQVKIEMPGAVFTFATTTQSGGNWLSSTQDGFLAVDVTATAANLAIGTYQGMLTINTTAPFVRHANLPITLTVANPTPPPIENLTVTPSTLTFTGPAGSSVTGAIAVNGSGPFTIPTAPPGQVTVTPASSTTTYTAPATVQFKTLLGLPGVYSGSITISWTGGSATVPITYIVTPTPSTPPVISTIVNSGSAITGSLTPGELITIYGYALGPLSTGLLIGGEPAPVIYSSFGQVNAIVPYDASVTGTATVQLSSSGVESDIWIMPLVPSVPSIFSLSSSGVGPGAIVNQDGTVNTPSNPAARGSYISIYGTGAGQNSLPVTVAIGGVNAPVSHSGNAPQEIQGLEQINVLVPQNLTPGQLPVLVTIGTATSQAGVTVAIQ